MKTDQPLHFVRFSPNSQMAAANYFAIADLYLLIGPVWFNLGQSLKQVLEAMYKDGE